MIQRKRWKTLSKPRMAPLGERNIIGEKVMCLRKAQGLKQKQLVAMLQSRGMDICDASMSRLEGSAARCWITNCPSSPTPLGVSVSWLLGEAQ